MSIPSTFIMLMELVMDGFSLDFDPITGMLWDTENGRNFGDEINLVEPGLVADERACLAMSWRFWNNNFALSRRQFSRLRHKGI
jgi:hypothetical protein